MHERLGGTRNKVSLTHLEVINAAKWATKPLSSDESEMNQEQAKELIEVLRSIDAKLDVLIAAARKPMPPVIGSGVLPRAEEAASAPKKR